MAEMEDAGPDQADRGDAVIVIEHHVDLLRACDQLFEMGPSGGLGGGRAIAKGTPLELVADARSVTGPWLEISPPTKVSRGKALRPGGKSGTRSKKTNKKRASRATKRIVQ